MWTIWQNKHISKSITPPIDHVLAKGCLHCLGSLRNHQMLELCFIFLKKLVVA